MVHIYEAGVAVPFRYDAAARVSTVFAKTSSDATGYDERRVGGEFLQQALRTHGEAFSLAQLMGTRSGGICLDLWTCSTGNERLVPYSLTHLFGAFRTDARVYDASYEHGGLLEDLLAEQRDLFETLRQPTEAEEGVLLQRAFDQMLDEVRTARIRSSPRWSRSFL
jgi:hypothetical protein